MFNRISEKERFAELYAKKDYEKETGKKILTSRERVTLHKLKNSFSIKKGVQNENFGTRWKNHYRCIDISARINTG